MYACFGIHKGYFVVKKWYQMLEIKLSGIQNTLIIIRMFCSFNNTKNYVETKSWIFLCDILAKANIFYVI